MSTHLLWKIARFSSSYISLDVYQHAGRARIGVAFPVGCSIGFLTAFGEANPIKELKNEDTIFAGGCCVMLDGDSVFHVAFLQL